MTCIKKILVVDDDIHIGNVLEETLEKEGYSVTRAYSGTEALLVLERRNTDLILLDLMLPGLSGEALLPKIEGIPIIIISAKVDVSDKVSLLMKGASDYVTKPFEIKELLARIAVQMRDNRFPQNSSILSFEEISLDKSKYTAAVEDVPVKLTRTEYAILKLLMQNPRQVITKSALLDSISKDTPDCTESSLKIHVSNLRKKLRAANGKDYIEPVWGIGFKLRDN